MGSCFSTKSGCSCDYRLYHYRHQTPEGGTSKKAPEKIGTYGEMENPLPTAYMANTWSPAYTATVLNQEVA